MVKYCEIDIQALAFRDTVKDGTAPAKLLDLITLIGVMNTKFLSQYSKGTEILASAQKSQILTRNELQLLKLSFKGLGENDFRQVPLTNMRVYIERYIDTFAYYD
jgi:Ca2+-binding EF-hand superfamily protein